MRNFIPQQFNITFESIESYYKQLLIANFDTKADLEKWLLDRSELEAALEEDFAWRYIKMTCDTTDEKLVADFQYFATEIEPKIAPYTNELNKKFINAPSLKELDQNKYFILIRGIKKQLELFREENIPLMSQLQVEQQKFGGISGAMSVIINDKEYTLEQASNFLKDTNREVRQQAYETISSRRLQDKDKLNELYTTLINLRQQVAKNAGFDNYRDYAFASMGRFDYTPEDCFQFHEAIEKEVVPLLKEQAEKRKDALGLNELKPWDTDVDVSGKPMLKPFNNGQELVDKSILCFEQLHPYLGECLTTMKERSLFDVESRKGKSPGGYNYPLAETGMPFIFMNSANSMRDLSTMVHEGGHAVHTFISSDLELNDFKHLTSEIAELASMSMELISMDQWDVFFDKEEDLIRAKKDQLKDVLKTLPWVAVIDAFQHWIYTHPEHSVEERNEAWISIYNRFGAGFVDWTGYEEAKTNLWQKQLHLFEVPFYYIEYAIAQLGAIAVWRNYKENPEKALDNYLSALKLGYTKPIGEIYKTAGIPFNFSKEYVHELMQFVKSELSKLD
ncbi:M3 family oligoendopeptidase [Solitalea canadensis]|uniref:Oligoendopeptidase, M3 family n=1 Tax=Solitalea canadensis (strain ATCC 29591 / DSM 3403 / JCM 21819 / LMG 8368 / NBRC 15130 / NCIMB 12057 / USAM 9D) TaxID=929556 RepID=H8KP43_SOLCM|nr:M3 family oligoendopeptidase [Solitalea canadensis]AFD05680.1 oligoendopeptidase, M3 family [Solitalea canadensis DSM 3403]